MFLPPPFNDKSSSTPKTTEKYDRSSNKTITKMFLPPNPYVTWKPRALALGTVKVKICTAVAVLLLITQSFSSGKL
jgi:hypothetical protein